MPDAGGLVIASDHETARAYAALLRRISGERPVVVLSDDPTASKKISAFAAVDRPLDGRGADGVRGRGRAPAGGRGVRDERVDRAVLRPGGRPVRPRPAARRDRVGLPARRSRSCSASPPSLRPSGTTWCAHLDRDPEAELEEAQRERKTPDDIELVGRSFEALKASATFDRVLFDGGEFGTATEAGSPEEEDYLGLPGLLEPDQVAHAAAQAPGGAARRPVRAAAVATGRRPGGRRPVRARDGAGRARRLRRRRRR